MLSFTTAEVLVWLREQDQGAVNWAGLKQTQKVVNSILVLIQTNSPFFLPVHSGTRQKAVKGLEEGGQVEKAPSCLFWWQSHFTAAADGESMMFTLTHLTTYAVYTAVFRFYKEKKD